MGKVKKKVKKKSKFGWQFILFIASVVAAALSLLGLRYCLSNDNSYGHEITKSMYELSKWLLACLTTSLFILFCTRKEGLAKILKFLMSLGK